MNLGSGEGCSRQNSSLDKGLGLVLRGLSGVHQRDLCYGKVTEESLLLQRHLRKQKTVTGGYGRAVTFLASPTLKLGVQPGPCALVINVLFITMYSVIKDNSDLAFSSVKEHERGPSRSALTGPSGGSGLLGSLGSAPGLQAATPGAGRLHSRPALASAPES